MLKPLCLQGFYCIPTKVDKKPIVFTPKITISQGDEKHASTGS